MKLIRILALATAVASLAAAQNPGSAAGQQSKPSPTPAGQQKGTPAKTSPAATNKKPSAASAKSSPTKNAAPAKGAVQTGVLPEKKSNAHKNPPAPAVSASKGAQAAPAATATKTAAPAKSPASAKTTTPPPAASAVKGPAGTQPAAPAKAASAAPANATKTVAKKAPVKATVVKKTTAEAQPPAAPPKVKATATGPSTIAQKKPAPRLIGAAGRRDPFVSPIRSASAGSPTQNCTSGKRCLAIPELTLQGTVRDISGKMMAIVATSTHRTYTLRENDQVFNGSVEKITTDSIIFREYVRDAVGRESAKEVVKKIGPTS